jgi:hypothetical protein
MPFRGRVDLADTTTHGGSVSDRSEHGQLPHKEILDEGELPEATIRKYRIVQTEGSREVARSVEHYNLEMTLAVGYRVRSPRGTFPMGDRFGLIWRPSSGKESLTP